MLKKIIRPIAPPFIYRFLSGIKNSRKNLFHPAWHLIEKGILKGRNLYIDPLRSYWQKEMLEGNYDDFLFNYILKFDLKGKTVIDVGAHIGYHSLVFSTLTGEKGGVISFEPNPENFKRFEKNLGHNEELKNRIRLFPMAVSGEDGEVTFHISANVDSGQSSGSFLSSANTYYEKSDGYLDAHEKITVQTITLDNVSKLISEEVKPFLIKIDVEGGESGVLEGARRIVSEYKPVIVIEVHSIFNMFHVSRILKELNYNLILLKEEIDGRCFIAAEPL